MIRVLVVLALALVSPTIALCQSQDTSAVPREFALALASSWSREPVVLWVKRIPDDFDRDLVPKGAYILGSVVYPPDPRGIHTTTIILALADDPKDAMAKLKTSLEHDGWKPAPERPMRGGFVSSMERGPSDMLCRSDKSLTINSEPRPKGGSLVRLSFTPRRGNMCDIDARQIEMMGRYREERPPMPTLLSPDGARTQGGGSGGGSGYWQSSTIVETSMSAADLILHYARQLPEQGWGTGKQLVDDKVVVQTTTKHEGGKELFGILGVVETSPNRRSVWFHMMTPLPVPR